MAMKNPSCVLRKGGGSFYYENRGVPALETDRDVIVRIVATGLCGSDVLSPSFICDKKVKQGGKKH